MSGQRKRRSIYSCLSCHQRKTKCDRAKPCNTCVRLGIASGCEYGMSSQDREFIQKSEVIERLRQRHRQLEKQLRELRAAGGASSQRLIAANGCQDTMSFTSSAPSSVSSAEDTPSPSAIIPFKPISPISMQNPEVQPLQNSQAEGQFDSERLVQQFLAEFCPRQASIQSFPSNLLLEASKMRRTSPPLEYTLDAAALTWGGRRFKNRNLEIAGWNQYQRALQLVRQAIQDPESSLSLDILVSILFFVIIECLKHSSKSSARSHLFGALTLLQHRTAYRHRIDLERSIYVELRLYWVNVAIWERQPTFLADEEWLTVPWMDGQQKDILQHLLDIAVHIPAYVAQVNDVTQQSVAGILSSAEINSEQIKLMKKATELDQRLEEWKRVHADPYPPGSPREVIGTSDDNFPLFRYYDSSTKTIVQLSNIVYPDMLSATALVYYWTYRLILTLRIPGVDCPQRSQPYFFARQICRSMKYHILVGSGLFSCQAIFALRLASNMFPPDSLESLFTDEMWHMFEQRFGFQGLKELYPPILGYV
ncbi:hypothetical protein ASPZODRAFT_2109176 [Penicilliopsis zonata CBS 506.65]|uniref:Zn(2)-C6 fungal-type domain-containing protein n=1 Tax=Penicilliopsis zonata CBS 506.65 TaxID=1073090 RepID=A0A1L9SFD3_9EURO|nr:hypothetical protein ASPZODRAFT_2109176 [Penicilliopsis zonata CBS 506.65]OJJ45862.1 hypothetical protein ASPZODRAFT_2109176 [Penicilliopsis zonata CBS 506.65]